MKFKFSVYSLITSGIFITAFLCLMLSYINSIAVIMYYPALVFFCAGFIMLSIAYLKKYLNEKWITDEQQDAIVMELAQGEDGERYVMQDPKQIKKQNRQKRRANFDKLLPFIVFATISCIFVYLLISAIIKLF